MNEAEAKFEPVDPAFSLQTAETALRRLIREVLGAAWVKSHGAPDLSKLEAKAEEDRKRRRGAAVNDDLLSYAELHSLINMIEKNWEQFKPALGDLQRTKVFLGIIADFRNAVAHSRVLLDFERNLLAGASGQLRNQVALYINRNDGPHRYYPIIESITNDFGIIDDKLFWEEVSQPRLNVGDVVNFTCVGNDPRGRSLKWRLILEGQGGRDDELLGTAVGDSVVLRWIVRDVHVAESVTLLFEMRHSGQYHRSSTNSIEGEWSEYDAWRRISYSVNPPLDS